MAIPTIQVRGACQNNLKNLDLDIPLNKITVVTGVSGSGKSSLAFDTLYAEGQRRYVETFSPYARQFMDRMDRPKVKTIQGIPPAIAIDRKDPVRTSRSTVGTMTEITDYVKLIFARMGQLHCRKCGKPVVSETPELIWQRLNHLARGSELVITYPVSLENITPKEVSRSLAGNGFDRIFFNNRIHFIEEWDSDHHPKELNVVVDRVLLRTKWISGYHRDVVCLTATDWPVPGATSITARPFPIYSPLTAPSVRVTPAEASAGPSISIWI